MKRPLPTRVLNIFSAMPQHPVTERYAVALATATLAVVARAMLDPVLGHVAFYATVYMAVAFSAVVCGLGPAALSAGLGFVGVFYWFVDPRHSVVVTRSEIHGVIGFVLVCAVLIALGATNRKKKLMLNQAVEALTKEAHDRELAEEKLQMAHRKLEQRVQERTAELLQALTQLKSEIEVRQQAEAELRHLSVRVMTLQDEERRRIARELHDSAGQTLAAIKMTLASLKTTGESDRMERLMDDLEALADEAVQEIRTTSYLLHPPLLDEAGIASAARWFVDGFSKRSGIRVECEIPDKMERLAREYELVLFRVLQESLTNVHRHSGASEVSVRFKVEQRQLQLDIGDNGVGIPEERLRHINAMGRSDGVGIAGMRERVRELGGMFDIRPGKSGTVVSVMLPTTSSVSKPHLVASAV